MRRGPIGAFLVLALAGAPQLSACAAPRFGVEGLNNGSAAFAIKARLLRSDFSFSGVDVVVVDGVALLMGHVPDEAAKAEAARIARSAPNVRDVGDELTVDPEGRRFLGASDQVVLSQVRSRLIAAKGVPSERVHIEVYDGVVYLLGRMRTASEAEAAAEAASVAPGVRRVVTYLSAEVPAVGVPADAAPRDPYAPQGRVDLEARPAEPIAETPLGAPER
jgi:osmotically-inducible protein OsmY